MKVFYAGDSAAGGAANYLLGILKSLRAEVTHVPPSKKLTSALIKKRFDAFILSDMPSTQVLAEAQRNIVRQVEKGAGLLMIGGWASFSGPFGRWRGTLIEGILPVTCLGRDDRLSFPSGAHIVVKEKHPGLSSISFENPPVICGANELRPKKNARVILAVRKVIRVGERLMLDPVEYPLLVADREKKIAAFATDLAPHWCGGLVDWGRTHIKLPVAGKIQIEVGVTYIRFVQSLLRWIASR